MSHGNTEEEKKVGFSEYNHRGKAADCQRQMIVLAVGSAS